jgi:hypothetical protein
MYIKTAITPNSQTANSQDANSQKLQIRSGISWESEVGSWELI